jgi:hypothetical protein
VSQATLYEECTVLELGARGMLQGSPFVLAGRTAIRSHAGGLWNEWTVTFDDGRHAFLAEALGAFTLFFEGSIAPPYEMLRPGEPPGSGFVVVERGEAKRVACWGDVPAAPRTYRYADLSSAAGESATIDYGDGGRADRVREFVGKRMALAELGLEPRAGRARFLAAPGGPAPNGVELWLRPGDEGELATHAGARARARFRVIGVVHRSIKVERQRYTWEEYVLHAPADGLRWLVVADGHWNFVESVAAGQVEADDRTARLHHPRTSLRFASRGKARVEWAAGELPWEIEVGDVTEARDYVCAPHVLSRESTPDEITWSLGTYTPPETIARAFGKPSFPRPQGRAPNQPKTPKRR